MSDSTENPLSVTNVISSRFLAVSQAIGKWSEENFGDQISKRTGAYLGSLAPLLGVGEELNDELMVAVLKKDEEITADAIADICVYLCDYARRENTFLVYNPAENLKNEKRRKNFTEQLITDLRFTTAPMERLLISYGRLLHVVLKAHQGIRGYNDQEKYTNERDMYLDCLMDALYEFVQIQFDVSTDEVSIELIDLVEKVYDKIVSKRNWVANPATAAETPVDVTPIDVTPISEDEVVIPGHTIHEGKVIE